MEKLNKVSLKRFALSVFWFHVLWLVMMFIGTIVEIFYPPYARTQLLLAIATALFQSLGQGWCPLTWLENSIWEKCYPERMYCDPETYQASFIRHCLKKFLGINAPKGTTTGLLILVLSVTLLTLAGWSLIVPEIAVAIVIFYWFFSSKTWRKIAGNGRLNILPTVVQWILIGIYILIVTLPLKILLKIVSEARRYPIARIVLSKFYLFLATGRGVEKVGQIAKGQHLCLINHGSHLDNSVISPAMEKTSEDDEEKWVVLADAIMFRIPPHSLFLETNGIKLDWQNMKKAMMSLFAAIKNGYSICMFYEGERSVGPDDQLLPAKQGAARIARMTGLEIQLILFFLPKRIAPKGWFNRPWFCMQNKPLRIVYGEIIPTIGREIEDIHNDIEQGMQKMLDYELSLEK